MEQIEIAEIQFKEKQKLLNLLEKYIFEASSYDLSDFNEDGMYIYTPLDYYWNEDGRHAYWILYNGLIAGFAMVSKHKDGRLASDWTMAEFCIIPKYRRAGIGKTAFNKIVTLHKGIWEMQYHPNNAAGKAFWHGVIDDYTGGEYNTQYRGAVEPYNDGSFGDIIYFKSC